MSIAILVVVLLIALVAAATVPVAQEAYYAPEIVDSGHFLTFVTVSFTPKASGYLTFTWSTTDGGTVTLELVHNASGGSTIYQALDVNHGAGNVSVAGGDQYVVGVLAGFPETVDFFATLHYVAPLL